MTVSMSAFFNVTIVQWLLITCILSVSLEWLLVLLDSRSTTPRYQWINSRWLPRLLHRKHAHEYVEDGYAKFIKPLDRPFKMIWWAREYIFLPPKYLRDLKRADEDSLSFFKNLSDAFSLHYSVGDLYSSSIMIEVLRKDLNTQLPTLIPLLDEEAVFAIEAEIGPCDKWKSFKANQLISRIMHRMTCRILLDDELCRDKAYVDASLKFMNSVVINALLSIMFPWGPFRRLFRTILAYFHRRNLESAVKIVLPMVQKRLQERELGDKRPSHIDATEWTIDRAVSDSLELDPRRITLNLLQNIWAGSAAPAALVTQMVYQVLMMPKYMESLRNEAIQATTAHGWTEKALSHMPLQDNFIKEINRLYPLGSVTAARTVMNKPFQFHDGLTLPEGTCIAFPIGAIQKDAQAFPDPLTFDGYRFVKTESNQDAVTEAKSSGSAQTISTTNLVFGYGKHACPGRFYAIRKVKLTFSRLIMEFEMKWDSVPRARPADFPVEGQFAPNLKQAIFLKRR